MKARFTDEQIISMIRNGKLARRLLTYVGGMRPFWCEAIAWVWGRERQAEEAAGWTDVGKCAWGVWQCVQYAERARL